LAFLTDQSIGDAGRLRLPSSRKNEKTSGLEVRAHARDRFKYMIINYLIACIAQFVTKCDAADT
jgi:hypothetical protein